MLGQRLRGGGIEGWFSEDEGRWYARFARGLVGGVFVEVVELELAMKDVE